MSPETIIVWNDGKSALTSHENFPDVVGETLDSTNWLSFDVDCWKFQENIIFASRGVQRLKFHEDFFRFCVNELILK